MLRLKSDTLTKILIYSLIIVFASCSFHTNKQLEVIEQIIEENPDSALHLIEVYEIKNDLSHEEVALYNLLLSYAKYKKFIELTNDSLLKETTDYFIKNGTPDRVAMSSFILGMTQLDEKKYGDAVVSFKRGLDTASKHVLPFWEGQCARGLFLLYGILHDSSAQLIFAEREHKAFSKANHKDWINWSILDIGAALSNNGQYEKSVETTDRLIENLNSETDSLLLGEAYAQLAVAQYSLGLSDKAVTNYIKSYKFKGDLDYNDKALLSMVVAEVDSSRISKDLFSVAEDIFNCSGKNLSFSVLAESGDFEGAYWDLVRYKNEQDSVLSDIIYNNVSESLDNYEKATELINQKQRVNERLLWIVSLLSLVLMMGVIILIFRIKLSRREMILQNSLDNLESLKNDFADLLNKNKFLSDSLIQSILDKYVQINSLCDEYYEKQYSLDKKNELESMIKKIKKMFYKKDYISQIEKDVDSYTKGLFSSFKRDFPDLKSDDIKLYMFLVLNFSSRTISVIMDLEISVIYNRKSRLKKKIQAHTTPIRDEYLRYIGGF
ncbi:MAG: hypothetical protein NC095_00865 [Muribaculum sp.]|nr:hypothetical protein [Muribaculum sp.]